MTKVMLVDDEISMRVLVERIIIEEGYKFCSAADGSEALELFDRELPDLLILDVMMPTDGFQTCRKLREKGVSIPIIFLSAKGDIVDKSVGFDAGGDDYLVKPFSPQELCLRIAAHLRQHARLFVRQDGHVEIGGVGFDIKKHRVTVRGIQVDLTSKEFQILFLMASQPGEIFTREQLIKEVWGSDFVGETSSIAVFVRRIREKIEEDPSRPRYLQTVRRVGYRFGD